MLAAWATISVRQVVIGSGDRQRGSVVRSSRSVTAVVTLLVAILLVGLAPEAPARADDRDKERVVVTVETKDGGPSDRTPSKERPVVATQPKAMRASADRLMKHLKSGKPGMRESSSPTQRSAPTQTSPDLEFVQACRDNWDTLPRPRYGWYFYNRFLGCMVNETSIAFRDRTPNGSCEIDFRACPIIGGANFRITYVAWGSTQGTTRPYLAQYREYMGDVGYVDNSQIIYEDYTCTLYDTATPTFCPQFGTQESETSWGGMVKTESRTATLAQWKLVNGSVPHFAHEADVTGIPGIGADSVLGVDISASFNTDGPRNNQVLDNHHSNGLNARCDRAIYANNGACILWGVAPHFQLDRADGAVAQSAQHIWDAQNNIGATFPGTPESWVPGWLDDVNNYAWWAPLTRTRDDGIQAANRRAARSECVKQYGTDYALGGFDCDEYPFASTLEGAASVDPTQEYWDGRSFSVRKIASADNQTAGSRLGAFYKSDNIIEGDEFWVKVH